MTGAIEPGSEECHRQHRQDQPGEGEQDVEHARDDVVEQPPTHAEMMARNVPLTVAMTMMRNGPEQAEAGAVDQPRQQVAPERVGAEQVLRRGSLVARQDVQGVGVVGGDQRREQRDER